MISSLSGVAGLPGDVAYTASKFAVEGATEALRHEVDRWNIRVALVEAGLYATRIFDASLPAGHEPASRGYPVGSEYRPLVEHRLRELRERLPDAFDPSIIGRLLVEDRRLRWQGSCAGPRMRPRARCSRRCSRRTMPHATCFCAMSRARTGGAQGRRRPLAVSRRIVFPAKGQVGWSRSSARARRGRGRRTYGVQPDEHRDGDHDPAREIRSRNALRGEILLSSAQDRRAGHRTRRGVGTGVAEFEVGDYVFMRMAHTSHWTLEASQCSRVPAGLDLEWACWCGLAKTAFRAAMQHRSPWAARCSSSAPGRSGR